MTDQDIIREAMTRLDAAYTEDMDNREHAINDLRFVVGEHYPEDVRSEREADNKPCLVFNDMPQFIRQVTAQVRSLNPAINISPSDNEASEDVAEIYAGMIRDIEQRFDATSIYEAAAESAAACGIGHFRVRTQYCGHDTFHQEVVIERVPNPFAVFWDPAAREPSRADARYCFIADEIPVETFKEMYPNATVVDATTEHQPITFVQSGSQDVVVVLEYFNVEHDEYDIWLAPDGSTLREKDFPPDLPPDLLDAAKAQMKTRRVRKPKVVWRKISAKDVLEGPVEMPCEQIPVFAVTGEEIHLGERVYRSSVIRHAKDAAFLYDLARSTEAEITMLQPRAPFLVTPMQVQNLEGFWADANRANRPYLLYNPDPKAPGAPQRVAPPVPSSALQNEIMLAAEDKKRTTGIYDAALGARSNETSGVAINARKQEAAAATSIYADNMVKAVTQCGRVITQMIPKIYDTQRVIRILGADHQEKAVVINQTLEGVDGAVVMNDVTRGAYSVRVSVGPAYQTMRQEAAESQMQFLREVPQAQALVADIVAANQDWPGADRIAERLRKALPPGIEEDDTQQPNPQQAQQMQMQQMMQSMQMRKAEAETREAEAQAAQAEAKAIEAQQSAKKAQAEATEAELKVRAIMAGMAASPLQPPVSGF